MSDSGPPFKRFRSSADINDAGPEAALSHLRQMASEIYRVTKTIPLFDGVTSQSDKLRKTTRPATKVLFYGVTGAGKSTVMNALLTVKLLPTSQAGACTPCPIEISFSREDRYVAELTFSTRETLEENVQDLLDYIEDHGDLHFTGGLEQTLRDVKSIAPSILNWLVEVPRPSAKTVVDRLPKDVRDLLGKKKILIAEQGQEEILRARLELYFWTDIPTDPAIAAALLDGPGVPMASIIEHVTIRANLPVLKGGLILQDLPGTGDVNARRRDAAQRYFEQADFIWVVAAMTRAVDDAGLRKLWQEASEASKKQMLNGRISKSKAPTLIITRIDDFDPQGMIREFKLTDSVGPVYASWKTKKEQHIKATQTALDTRNQANYGVAFELGEQELALRRELKSKVVQGFRQPLASRLQDAYCQDIRVDVVEDEDDGDEVVPPDVFCVSAAEYLTALHQNGDFQFLSEDDTGIPGLSEYCQLVARADRNDMVTGMLTSLDKLGRQMSALAMSLKDASENVTTARASVETYVKDHSINTVFQTEWKRHADNLSAALREHIRQPLQANLQLGAQVAQETAVDTATSFALTRCVAHPNRMHWATFRAVLRHNGVFRGHDLNELLVRPLTDHVAASWGRTFGDSLAKRFPPFQSLATKALQGYMSGLRKHLRTEGHRYTTVYDLVDNVRVSAKQAIASAFVSSLANLQTKQRKASRSMWLKVRGEMGPVYQVARDQKGAGSIRGIKNQLREHVETVHTSVFGDIVTDVTQTLDKAANHAGNIVSRGLKSVSGQIAQDLKTISLSPGSRTTREMVICQRLGQEVVKQVGYWKEARQRLGHESDTWDEDEEEDDAGEPMNVDA